MERTASAWVPMGRLEFTSASKACGVRSRACGWARVGGVRGSRHAGKLGIVQMQQGEQEAHARQRQRPPRPHLHVLVNVLHPADEVHRGRPPLVKQAPRLRLNVLQDPTKALEAARGAADALGAVGGRRGGEAREGVTALWLQAQLVDVQP